MNSQPPVIRRWTMALDRSHPELNEDASRADLHVGPSEWTALLVVADGAGSTPFAGAWARALVEAAVPSWATDDVVRGVAGVRRSFDPIRDQDVDFVLEDLWKERGSAATIVVAAVRSMEAETLCRVSIVGDCLMLISQPESLFSFPQKAASDFSGRTHAVSTQTDDIDVVSTTCEVPAGSMLVLSSDGIGAWLLRVREADGPRAIYEWLRTASDATLPQLDDDLTLLVLDVPPLEPRRPRVSAWRRVRDAVIRRADTRQSA
jgi:Protein phosphatase 2C